MPAKGNLHVDIFIPQKFMKCLPVCVFGVYGKVDENSSYVNCTLCFNIQTNTTREFLTCAEKLEHQRSRTNQKNKLKSCLGILHYNTSHDNTVICELAEIECPAFLVTVGETKNLTFLNWDSNVNHHTVVLYDSEKLYSSELLGLGKEESFVKFLLHSWEVTEMIVQKETNFNYLQGCANPPQLPWVKGKLINALVPILSLLCYICDWFSERIPETFRTILTVTTTGKQIACKSHHLKTILHDLTRTNRISLVSGNLLSAMIIDSVFGLLVTCFFCEYLQPAAVVEVAISQTDMVVSYLQDLLFWLMGIPAGLKLNLPLNSALGRFFLYHIYLWKTYIALIKPFLLVMLEFSLHFGILGLSFLISLCTDLLSLATLHIYCFYGYAARIYSLKLSGLIAFWRLFRGKKWNPLRNRVDSFTYDVQQLFLGTLIFTVLVFLLPTVALYYTVFTMLRLVVLILQIILCKIVDVLTAFPLYVILLHFSGHPLVKGDINMKVSSSNQEGISLSLEVISLSLSVVLQKTLPTRRFCIPLSPKDVLKSVIFGNIIYPL